MNGGHRSTPSVSTRGGHATDDQVDGHPNGPRRTSTPPVRPHAAFVLLAEFDIDTGSGLKHQYPRETGTSEHMLADLMLPDGAHDRTEDWTVFFLNQTPALTLQPLEHQPQHKGLLYVISLVRTKKDSNVRRGAVCKAMAVCSPYPYIQIFKPILLLALEDYFVEPSIDCLAHLYDAINAMDLAGMPRLSVHERLILRSSERKDLFDEKFYTSDDGASAQTDDIALDGDLSSHSTDRKSLRSSEGTSDEDATPETRGRLGPDVVQTVTAPQNGITGTGAIRRLKDTHFFDTRINYNNRSIPVRIPLQTFDEEVGEYSLIKLIQTFSSPAALSTGGPLHPHLHTSGPFTHPIILLFNALITEKRVVFLGYGQPAGVVAELILAACALGSGCGGVLGGFTERAFPYSNLTIYEDFKAVPGYIAGVTNPIFELHSDSWDVFCNIETGKITVSKDIANASPTSRSFSPPPFYPNVADTNSVITIQPLSRVETESLRTSTNGPSVARIESTRDSMDNVFMDEIMQAIQAHFGESVIRARFADYVQRFVRLASRHEEVHTGKTTIGPACRPFTPGQLGSGAVFPDELTMQKEMSINVTRIEGWQKTKSYKLLQKAGHQTCLSFDASHQFSRLRWNRKISEEEVQLLFDTLIEHVSMDAAVVELMSHLPSHLGGLVPLAFGLFHPSPTVRSSTVDFFRRLESHPTGRKMILTMNTFQRLALLRLLQERTEAQSGTPSP